MELCGDVLKGLQLVGDVRKLDDDNFERLVRRAISTSPSEDEEPRDRGSVTTTTTAAALPDIVAVTAADGPALVKLAFYSLVTLFVEAAKHGIDAALLQSLLEDCHFSNERISFVSKLYEERKPSIELLLKRISFDLPHVVDVNWRLDYCIKSDVIEKIEQPTYLVTLDVQGNGRSETEQVAFNCTVDELQDFVVKLKDGVKCLERVSRR